MLTQRGVHFLHLKFIFFVLVLTAASEGMAGTVHRAAVMLAASPDKYFLADQFANPATR